MFPNLFPSGMKMAPGEISEGHFNLVAADLDSAFTIATLWPGLTCSFRSKLHKIEHAIECTRSWPAGAV